MKIHLNRLLSLTLYFQFLVFKHNTLTFQKLNTTNITLKIVILNQITLILNCKFAQSFIPTKLAPF